MSYQVIARKWRPQAFEEVTGQEHITQTLRNAIEFDRLHHAYLFSGARGVGKTTTARLLAKALNCHKAEKPNLTPCRADDPDACPSCIEISESRSIDVLEFDAASNTQVDKIREIILENINITPARDRYKIFIIDEVHMLSTSSFNALLKTVEEPPPNVVFVMATTELHKVPDTITSRSQQFVFRTISLQKIFDRLKLIAEAEKIEATDAALRELARSGEGSMRDAQGNLDQVISFAGTKFDVAEVTAALGLASRDTLAKTIAAIAQRDAKTVLYIVDEIITQGQDLRSFCRDVLGVIRDLMVFKISEGAERLVEGATFGRAELERFAAEFSPSDLLRMFNSLALTESGLKDATQPRYMVETGLVKLTELGRLASIESILERLTAIESGVPATPSEPAKTLSATAEKKTLNADEAQASSPPVLGGVTEGRGDVPERSEPVSHVGIPADLQKPARVGSPYVIKGLSAELQKPARQQGRTAGATPATPASIGKPNVNESPPALAEPVPGPELPPRTAEELEHFDHDRLDFAWEWIISARDCILPIAGAREMIRPFAGEIAVGVGAGGSTSTVERKSSTVANGFDRTKLPKLKPDATDAELREFAENHPLVKLVIEKFEAEIVEVTRI